MSKRQREKKRFEVRRGSQIAVISPGAAPKIAGRLKKARGGRRIR
jgi:hypothetical protein